ncbi:Uncharacterised protein [Mycobacteroides abscessus subsp. abscessus]|nr:Uncharacterised protein [Mycobacteroides abscessus subsp. abscessus]
MRHGWTATRPAARRELGAPLPADPHVVPVPALDERDLHAL